MVRKYTGWKPPKEPKPPPIPSEKARGYRDMLVEAIQLTRVVKFTYATDNHQTWRECHPCKVGTLTSGKLGFVGYNPDWRNKGGARQPFKLFDIEDMDNLEIENIRSETMLPYPFTSDDRRFSEIDASM